MVQDHDDLNPKIETKGDIKQVLSSIMELFVMNLSEQEAHAPHNSRGQGSEAKNAVRDMAPGR